MNRDIIEQVVAACRERQAEAAEAFGRAFETPVQVTIAHSGALNIDQLPGECRGPGLVLILKVNTEAILVAVPESSGFVLPRWRQMDQPLDKSLATLAHELGQLLVPQPFTPDQVSAVYVSSLESAIGRSDLSPQASYVALQMQSGERSGIATMVWPATAADAALRDRSSNQPSRATQPDAKAPNVRPQSSHHPRVHYQELDDGLAQLPCYSRSLLKIKVPVMVTLAESKQPVENVLNIGPGSIIHFNKPCEDTLTLEVAGQKIAVGEAVKVGDKFGLWITAMILPEERFWVINDRAVAERAK